MASIFMAGLWKCEEIEGGMGAGSSNYRHLDPGRHWQCPSG